MTDKPITHTNEELQPLLDEYNRLVGLEQRIMALMAQYSDSPMLSMSLVWKAVHGK